jgi:hypothetical protein
VRLCRYHGLNAARRLGLADSRLVTDTAVVVSLARQLDSLPRVGRTIYHCPADDGSEILLVFSYADRSPVRVTVGLRGCEAVVGGSTSTLAGISRAGVRLVTRLTALTR